MNIATVTRELPRDATLGEVRNWTRVAAREDRGRVRRWLRRATREGVVVREGAGGERA